MAKKAKRTIVTVSGVRLDKYKGDMLAVGLFEGAKGLPAELVQLDKTADGALKNVLKLGDFSGKANETAVLYTSGKVGCKRIMLVGLGQNGKFKLDGLRQSAGTAARTAEKLGVTRLGLAVHGAGGVKLSAEQAGQAITEGAIIGRYDYQEYLSEAKDNGRKDTTMQVTIVEPKASAVTGLNRGRRVGMVLGEGQNYARTIANKPGNEINPPSLAREAQKLAREVGLKCKIFDERKLSDMGMNGILAVGSGSASKPRLIMLEHKGRRTSGARKAGPDVVVVGKAITFDSGGISIKPSEKMEEMKFDKTGGCAVLGIMRAVAAMKLPLHVVGLIPSAENLPSHTSYRPGDIVRTYSGKTLEVQNTDAEGRIILCDALAYAAKMKPKAIVDMATLTGACVVALGVHYAGLFGNNAALKSELEKAAQVSGDLVWGMPSDEGYFAEMKSKIADLKNISNRKGGACTAAAFLGDFVGDVPWAHIDIAAVADTDVEKPYRGVGATGFAVRLVMEYLRSK